MYWKIVERHGFIKTTYEVKMEALKNIKAFNGKSYQCEWFLGDDMYFFRICEVCLQVILAINYATMFEKINRYILQNTLHRT